MIIANLLIFAVSSLRTLSAGQCLSNQPFNLSQNIQNLIPLGTTCLINSPSVSGSVLISIQLSDEREDINATWAEMTPFPPNVFLNPSSKSDMGMYGLTFTYATIFDWLTECSQNWDISTLSTFGMTCESIGYQLISQNFLVYSCDFCEEPSLSAVYLVSPVTSISLYFLLLSSFPPSSQELILEYWQILSSTAARLAWLDDSVNQISYFINVISSLSCSQGPQYAIAGPNSSNPLNVTTPSQNLIEINIQILGDGQFVTDFTSQGYDFTTTFSNNNQQVIISTTDSNSINDYIQALIYFGSYARGTVFVNDNMNPSSMAEVAYINEYFTPSDKPEIDVSCLGYRITQAVPKTGAQMIVFFEECALESQNQVMTFSLTMQDQSPVPSWLNIKGSTLTGVPPNSLFNRNLDLVLNVSNQYYSQQANFSLNIQISWEYGFQLLVTIGSAALTAIGFIVYASNIYNVCAKQRYQFPRNYFIKVGQEVGPKDVFPIPFAQPSISESEVIIQHIEKKVKKESKASSKEQLAKYFVFTQTALLDRTLLSNLIKEAVAEICEANTTKLELYLSTETSHKRFIDEFIVNHFVLQTLDLKEERATKRAFKLIKKHVFDVVELDPCSPQGLYLFEVNKHVLLSKLGSLKINVSTPQAPPKEKGVRVNKAFDFLHSQLIAENPKKNSRDCVNLDLLIDALEAYAFTKNILDAKLNEVDVVFKKKVPQNCIVGCFTRFLKIDLKLVGVSGKKLKSYGLRKEMHENYLWFSGKANFNFVEDVPLVAQIVTKSGRILREIWIQGYKTQSKSIQLSETL